MKRMAIATVVLVLGAGAAQAEDRTYRFYDDSGRYRGRAEAKDNGVVRYYDDSGRYEGRTERQRDVVRGYDDKGRTTGRIEVPEENRTTNRRR